MYFSSPRISDVFFFFLHQMRNRRTASKHQLSSRKKIGKNLLPDLTSIVCSRLLEEKKGCTGRQADLAGGRGASRPLFLQRSEGHARRSAFRKRDGNTGGSLLRVRQLGSSRSTVCRTKWPTLLLRGAPPVSGGVGETAHRGDDVTTKELEPRRRALSLGLHGWICIGRSP